MTRQRKRRAHAIGPLIVLGAMAFMIAFTWGGWPDPLIDFGRELYVPWQLAQGKVLYRDVAHFNGPLSQYFNAMLFRVLGVSVRTLVVANIAIALLSAGMIYRITRRAGDRVSAAVCGVLFATLFFSIQLVPTGNYNWVTPYSHELTHGVALSLCMIVALMGFVARPSRLRALVIGSLLGLIVLTKPEVFAASMIVSVVGIAVALRGRKDAKPQAIMGVLVVGFVVPVAAAVMLLALSMSWRDALRGTLGGWIYVFDRNVNAQHFYRATLGIDAPSTNVARAIFQTAMYLIALAPAALIDRGLAKRAGGWRVLIAITYSCVLVALLWKFDAQIGWHDAFRGLMPLCSGALLLMRPRGKVRFLLVLFALLMLAKIGLAARLSHYGFVLALPALLIAAMIGVSWVPERLRRGAPISRGPWTLQLATISALALIVVVHLRAYTRLYHDKPIIVAEGTADQFRSAARGLIVNHLVDQAQALPESATLAVLPQGAMVNYLSGRTNPTPYISLMPPEVMMFGDATIRDTYAAHPPDQIDIIGTDLDEYGFTSLEEYAPLTARWVRENYVPMESRAPDGLPSLTILRRR